MIKVVNDLKTLDLELAATIKFAYDDLVHFLGEPIVKDGESDRRVEWQIYAVEEKKKEDGTFELIRTRATIYDSDLSIPMKDNFIWNIGGHCSRSFEVVAEYIFDLRESGKDFITKALVGEENKGETDNYQVSMDNKDENGDGSRGIL